MSDWHPQVTRIKNIRKHPEADALDIATVWDYDVIVKLGQFQIDQLVGYIPIDSIVPDINQFYFLCPKAYEKYEEDGEVKQRQIGMKYALGEVPEKYRIIKAKKIRGVYSLGMLVDLPTCSVTDGDGNKIMDLPDHLGHHWQEGESIVEALGLTKWEEQEEENLPGLKKTGTNAERAPLGWSIPHYNIDGIRKYLECLSPNEEIVLTEKIHGSNAAFCHDGNRLWVKSRNYYKKMDEDDMWWDIALRYNLEGRLAEFPMKVFFGEVYGQVKGFRYDTVIEGGRLLTKIRFFDVWDTTKMRYLDYPDRLDLINHLDLDPVPELYRGPWTNKSDIYSYAEGMSTLNSKHIREGIVINSLKERFEPKLNSRLQLKLVGEGYNLQK